MNTQSAEQNQSESNQLPGCLEPDTVSVVVLQNRKRDNGDQKDDDDGQFCNGHLECHKVVITT